MSTPAGAQDSGNLGGIFDMTGVTRGPVMPAFEIGAFLRQALIGGILP